MNTLRKLMLAMPIALFSLTAFAEHNANTHEYSITDKLGRGASSMALPFLEIPGNIVKETKENGALGVPYGFGIGVSKMFSRELVGIYEVLTAPIPLPANYKPLLMPEYPWDYFKK